MLENVNKPIIIVVGNPNRLVKSLVKYSKQTGNSTGHMFSCHTGQIIKGFDTDDEFWYLAPNAYPVFEGKVFKGTSWYNQLQPPYIDPYIRVGNPNRLVKVCRKLSNAGKYLFSPITGGIKQATIDGVDQEAGGVQWFLYITSCMYPVFEKNVFVGTVWENVFYPGSCVCLP